MQAACTELDRREKALDGVLSNFLNEYWAEYVHNDLNFGNLIVNSEGDSVRIQVCDVSTQTASRLHDSQQADTDWDILGELGVGTSEERSVNDANTDAETLIDSLKKTSPRYDHW